MNRLRENLEEVMERIAGACARAGRKEDEVMLVAVTKTVGAELVRKLYELGIREIGENRVQEALRKAEFVGELEGVRWHMVGHLQRNKVRHALRLFSLIHSVDSTRLIEALQKEAEKRELHLPVLVEVNVSGEQSKFGIAPEALDEVLNSISSSENLKLRGLMTMAPLVDDPEKTRPIFSTLRKLRNKYAEKGYDLPELSMGMTQDFEVAVEEGATMVRIGTALFRGLLGWCS